MAIIKHSTKITMTTPYDGPICDPHLHFWDFDARPNPNIEGGLKGTPACRGGVAWGPKDYLADAGDLPITSLVHVETIDERDPVGETKWVASLAPQLRAACRMKIVCFVDLALPSAADVLAAQMAAAGPGVVVGVRHILNHDPSWPNVKEDVLPSANFRAGYAKLAEHGLSFDLQINPHQMESAAELCAALPSVPVCLNHLGCLKLSGAEEDAEADAAAIVLWRAGMTKLAALSHVHVKLSMLPYCLKGFWSDAAKADKVKALVAETIALFGADRCMLASNYPVDLNDGMPLATIYSLFREWTAGYSADEQRALFHDTAAKFYKLV
jgi:predicted TIM-barrel fold metal-dependent hydrolase